MIIPYVKLSDDPSSVQACVESAFRQKKIAWEITEVPFGMPTFELWFQCILPNLSYVVVDRVAYHVSLPVGVHVLRVLTMLMQRESSPS